MRSSTRILRKRMGIVFDFDGTLAPDSYAALVASCGLDPSTFHRERVAPLLKVGWEEIPAKFYALIQESKRRTKPADKITQERIEAFARKLMPFDGVQKALNTLRERVRALDPDITVEYYLLSSGIADIARNTDIAQNFKAIWGCEFHYAEDGEVDFVKRIVSHVEKLRYLRQIARGIHEQHRTAAPEEIFGEPAPDDLYLPLDQVVYVGDGASDVPAFALMARVGGVALGVNKASDGHGWTPAVRVDAQERVSNLAPPDYTEGSELVRSLTLAVERICKQIGLRELGAGE